VAVLSIDQARAFYDRFGAKQDLQRFYEDPALDQLLANADLRTARAVVEFGCGTGRLAARMLDELLPADAVYFGYDVSETMVGLARARLARFGVRASIARSDGSARLPLATGSCDRFVCTYVLDLLARGDARAVASEAARVLARDGRICLTSLTRGTSPFSRILQSVWEAAWQLRPQLVGGCRPIELADSIGSRWRIQYREIVCTLGLCSEVLIAASPVARKSAR
jgi:SAM-dependent methyltransferase